MCGGGRETDLERKRVKKDVKYTMNDKIVKKTTDWLLQANRDPKSITCPTRPQYYYGITTGFYLTQRSEVIYLPNEGV